MNLVYPVRKRCGRCRQYFAWVVLLGVYCSPECAGMPRPSLNPDDWPREHYTKGYGGPKRLKRAFLSEEEAKRWAGKRGKEAYRCNYCLTWHIGSLNPENPPAPRIDYQLAILH